MHIGVSNWKKTLTMLIGHAVPTVEQALPTITPYALDIDVLDIFELGNELQKLSADSEQMA